MLSNNGPIKFSRYVVINTNKALATLQILSFDEVLFHAQVFVLYFSVRESDSGLSSRTKHPCSEITPGRNKVESIKMGERLSNQGSFSLSVFGSLTQLNKCLRTSLDLSLLLKVVSPTSRLANVLFVPTYFNTLS